MIEPRRFGFRELLVPIDLTPASDRVLARLALLPLARGARVTLFHAVPPSGVPQMQSTEREARRQAKRDATKAVAEHVTDLARELSSSVGATIAKTITIVPVVSVGVAVPSAIAACSADTNPEMIVMGRGHGRVLRDHFLGSTAERVVRRTHLPVLVVRRAARSHYSRPAIALDLDKAANPALTQLLKVIPAPRPQVMVIHAYDPPYQHLVYESPLTTHEEPSSSDTNDDVASDDVANAIDEAASNNNDNSDDDDLTEDLLDAHRHEAIREIDKLLTGIEIPAFTTYVKRGAPRSIIEKAIKNADADLLVMGTHGRSGLAQVLLGTIAGDVLRAVDCDVLLVPPRAVSLSKMTNSVTAPRTFR